MKINFADFVVNNSKSLGNKLAYRDGTEDLDYLELSRRIPILAEFLLSRNIKSGDHVVISMEDSVDWPVVFLACLYIGVVPLPLSTSLGNDLFKKIVEFVEAKLIFKGDHGSDIDVGIPVLRRQEVRSCFDRPDSKLLPVLQDPNSPAYMNVSSGSTGTPKVAMHRHQTLFEILKLSPALSFSMTRDSVILSVAKMSWNFGLQNSVTYTLGLGATAIVIPDAPAAPTIFEYINRYQPSIVVTSPSIIRRLVSPAHAKHTLPNCIKHFHSSGEHLPMPLYEQFEQRFGIKLNSCIGMMETCTNYAANPDFEHDPGTVGKALPGCKIRLLNHNGKEVSDVGAVGEIYVSSPARALYYYKNQEKTNEVFLGDWVRTGDLAYYNKNNNLTFVGRVDDVFKINDLIVSPVEIEAQILKFNTVDQVTVCGIDNAKGVKDVHVFVVPRNNFDLGLFNQYLKENLFSHQLPKKVHLVEDLPQTVTNKKVRSTLKALVANEQ